MGGYEKVGGIRDAVWRRLEKVCWAEHRTNEEVVYGVEEKRSLVATIRERWRMWIGRILTGHPY